MKQYVIGISPEAATWGTISLDKSVLSIVEKFARPEVWMSRLRGNLVLRRRGGAGTKRHQGGEAENWKRATGGHRFYPRVSGGPSWHGFSGR
jgi:hypothetical protein